MRPRLVPDHIRDTLGTSVIDLERSILRAVCTGSINQEAWQRVSRDLADYDWREPDHAALFRAIVKVRGRNREHWRHDLPAETTRMGFPDLDWAPYLHSRGMPQPSLDELVLSLKAATRER